MLILLVIMTMKGKPLSVRFEGVHFAYPTRPDRMN